MLDVEHVNSFAQRGSLVIHDGRCTKSTFKRMFLRPLRTLCDQCCLYVSHSVSHSVCLSVCEQVYCNLGNQSVSRNLTLWFGQQIRRTD